MKKVIFITLLFVINNNIFSQWNTVPSGTNEFLISLSFPSANVGYCISETGVVHKTTNSGNNWSTINTINGFRLIFQNDLIGLAYGNNQILKTTNGGTNWTVVLDQSSTRYVSGLTMLDANNGFACSMNFNDSVTIYSTSNGGDTWTFVSDDVNNVWDCAYMHFKDANNGFIGNLMGELFKTSDGGLNWTNVFFANGVVSDIQFTSSTIGYGVSDTEFLTTSDGGDSWTASTPPFSAIYTNIHITPNGTIHLVGGNGLNTATLIKSVNNGSTWTQTGTGTQQYYGLDFINDTLGFTCGTNGSILRFGNSTVGIANVSPLNLEVYPNPASDFVNIIFPENINKENINIQVFDNTGRVLISQSTFTSTIDLSNFSNGIYFLEIQTETKSFREKIIKN